MVHRVPRYQLVVPIRYTAPDGHEGTGWTRDLSLAGACLELPERFRPGPALGLRLETDALALALSATVIWEERLPGATWLHGVHFTVPAEVGAQLGAWLEGQGTTVGRIPAAFPVKCERLDQAGPPLEGWTADVGTGGAVLALPERLAVGTLLRVILSTPGGEAPMKGVIVWEGPRRPVTDRQLFEHGVRFTSTTGQPAGQSVVEGLFLGRPAAEESQTISGPEPTQKLPRDERGGAAIEG